MQEVALLWGGRCQASVLAAECAMLEVMLTVRYDGAGLLLMPQEESGCCRVQAA